MRRLAVLIGLLGRARCGSGLHGGRRVTGAVRGGPPRSPRARSDAEAAEGAPPRTGRDRPAQRGESRGWHARLRPVGRLRGRPAPRGRLPTAAPLVLVRPVSRDSAAPPRLVARARSTIGRDRFPDVPLLRQRESDGAGRPRRARFSLERLRGVGLRGLPARRRCAPAPRHLLHVAEGAERPARPARAPSSSPTKAFPDARLRSAPRSSGRASVSPS